MAEIVSFAPIADENAEILILGSMPGCASLNANQYYAHKRNAFWRIMSELLKLDAKLSYDARTRALKSARIALWDVIHACERKGSLDANIEPSTLVTNDFPNFFRTHQKIKQVFFNGTKAETCFKQYVLKTLDFDGISFTRLPSTSPAHAAVSFERKLDAWRLILDDKQLMSST